jgi:ParB-like chromosome segregation protein Spo0J
VRLGAVSHDYVNVMAQSYGQWPPVVVRRADLTVVDGWYRCLAARQLGHTHLECVYFDGSVEAAYLEALRRNLHQGLPLSLRERKQACRHVLLANPQWSDRRVAEACGLSPGTVGRLGAGLGRSIQQDQLNGQDRSTAQNGQLNGRKGRDGRFRPVDRMRSRERIIAALDEQPEASLRGIARLTGTSPATVRAVRARLTQDVPRQQVPGERRPPSPQANGNIFDAALLSAPKGDEFRKWFGRTGIGEEWRDYVDAIPISRAYDVGDEARRRAKQWLDFASALEERTHKRESYAAT